MWNEGYWNERYGKSEYSFGTRPNDFLFSVVMKAENPATAFQLESLQYLIPQAPQLENIGKTKCDRLKPIHY